MNERILLVTASRALADTPAAFEWARCEVERVCEEFDPATVVAGDARRVPRARVPGAERVSASQNELRDIARRSATQGLLALARGLAALAEGDNTTAAREMVLGRAFVDGARAAQQALYERVMDRAQAHRVEALKRGDVLATRTTRGWPQVECPTLAGTTWLRGPPVPLP